MEEELYRKVGRRYQRVNDPWAYNGLPEGHWHVWVRPPNKTIRKFILPDKKEVFAAIEEVREAMIEAMQDANKARPNTWNMTARELKAFELYKQALGDDNAYITYTGMSMSDVVDAGIRELIKHWGE